MDTKIKIGVIIQNNKSQLLLIKEKFQKNNNYHWNIITGTIDKSDESLTEAVKREVIEETTTTIDIVKLVGIYYYNKSNKVRLYSVFQGQIKEGEPQIPAQQQLNESIREMKWFDKEELIKIKEKDFVNTVSYEIVQDYINQKLSPMDGLRELK